MLTDRKKHLPVLVLLLGVGACGANPEQPRTTSPDVPHMAGDTSVSPPGAPVLRHTPSTRRPRPNPQPSRRARYGIPPNQPARKSQSHTIQHGRPFQPPGPRGPAQTQPNGTVIIPPAAPTQTVQSASNACAILTLDMPEGGTKDVKVPPAPGLQATLQGGDVLVTFDTGQPPRACRPKVIRILIDDDDHAFPPVSDTYELGKLGPQSLSIPIPRALQSTPTLVQASLGLRPEFRGPNSRIKISN